MTPRISTKMRQVALSPVYPFPSYSLSLPISQTRWCVLMGAGLEVYQTGLQDELKMLLEVLDSCEIFSLLAFLMELEKVPC